MPAPILRHPDQSDSARPVTDTIGEERKLAGFSRRDASAFGIEIGEGSPRRALMFGMGDVVDIEYRAKQVRWAARLAG